MAARRTTSKTTSTTDAKTDDTKATTDAKADDTATTDATVTKADEDKAAEAVKNDDTAAANEAKTTDDGEIKDVSTAQVGTAKLEENPDLSGDHDKVAEAREAEETRKENSTSSNYFEEAERKTKEFVENGGPTSEAYDDPHVNLANLPVNHDPVVATDHAQASVAASVPVAKFVENTPVQIAQLDTSGASGQDALNVLSHRVVSDTSDKDDSDKK